MTISTAQAAAAMGMKEREISAVVQVAGGYLVTTVDGQSTQLAWATPDTDADGGSPAGPVKHAPAKKTPPTKAAAKKTTPTKTAAKKATAKSADKEPDAGQPPVDPGAYPADADADTRLAWVQETGLAAAALDFERARDEPDTELIVALEQLDA